MIILEAFRIEPRTGNVFLRTTPELKTYYLGVQASDDGTCPGCPAVGNVLTSETSVMEVTIVDRNRYSPTFTSCNATMSILELAAAGTVIGDVG